MNTTRPKIALYQPYPHSFAGLQTVVVQLAQTLPEHGYEPIILCPEEGKFTETARALRLDCLVSDPGSEWRVYGQGGKSLSYLLSPKRVFGLFRYWFKLSGELRRNQIALLHCNDYRGVILAAPAARLARIPVLWHMHGFVPSRLVNLAAAVLAQWVVPVSRGMLDYLKLPRWLLGRHEVIHNGVEMGLVGEGAEKFFAGQIFGGDCPLRPALSPAEGERENCFPRVCEFEGCGFAKTLDAALPLPRRGGEGRGEGDELSITQSAHSGMPSTPRDFPIVLAVGTLHPRKGYETLIHAFKRVAARLRHAECWIAGGEFGDGRYGRQLRELAQNLGLGERIKFLGHSSEVTRLMQRCTVLAVPSRVEVFGLVALEAMRAGKPVVACRTGGLPEIVAHRHSGVLVPPADPAQMAMALVEILGNKNLAEKMGRAGQLRVSEEFSLGKMTSAFAAFYGRVLDGSTSMAARFTAPSFWRRHWWWRKIRPAPARLQPWHRSTIG